MNANNEAHPSHPCPVTIGAVVEMRDGHHNGTAIWRRDDNERTFAFASLDRDEVGYAERCVLMRNVALESIPSGYPYGCDTQADLVLLGVDYDEDPLSLVNETAEILWDSRADAIDLLDGHPKAQGHEDFVADQQVTAQALLAKLEGRHGQ